MIVLVVVVVPPPLGPGNVRDFEMACTGFLYGVCTGFVTNVRNFLIIFLNNKKKKSFFYNLHSRAREKIQKTKFKSENAVCVIIFLKKLKKFFSRSSRFFSRSSQIPYKKQHPVQKTKSRTKKRKMACTGFCTDPVQYQVLSAQHFAPYNSDFYFFVFCI